MRSLFAFLLLATATSLTAQGNLPDLRVQNSGGTMMEIHDVWLIRAEPDGLRVRHSAGVAKVPYELLPEALQEKYGFTWTTASDYRKSEAAKAEASVSDRRPALAPASVPQITVAPVVAYQSVAAPSSYSASPVSYVRSRFSTPRMSRRSEFRLSGSYYGSYPYSCRPAVNSYYAPPVTIAGTSRAVGYSVVAGRMGR